MANINDIATGLRVPAQIPLDAKLYIQNEATLANLGTSNNLAFTYYKGMIIYAVEEQTRWEWREVVGLEVGLLPSNFTYPDSLVVFGIDYSLKVYNFFEVMGAVVPLNQNNFVRVLPIELSDLGILDAADVTPAMVCNYVNLLPNAEKTILETDSKWNILIQNTADDSTIVYKIYEVINRGKGILTLLVPEDLLVYTAQITQQGFEDVLNQDSNLTAPHPVIMSGSGAIFFVASVNNAGLAVIKGQAATPSVASMEVGISDIDGFPKTSLAFYSTKSVFTDDLEKGIEYAGDYEPNFTARSLITKQHFDNEVVAAVNSAVTAAKDKRYVAWIMVTPGSVVSITEFYNTFGSSPIVTLDNENLLIHFSAIPYTELSREVINANPEINLTGYREANIWANQVGPGLGTQGYIASFFQTTIGQVTFIPNNLVENLLFKVNLELITI